MKIIITDAWIGTQMNQKSIPGKHDTSISHRRTQENSTQNQDSYKSQARLKTWIVRIKGMRPTLALSPRLPSPCPNTHIQRGLRGGGRGMGWGMAARCSVSWLPGRQQAVWVGWRAKSRPLHTGTHWKPIALHHFIKLLVYLFVLLLCVRREGERLLGVWALWIPVLFLVQSLGLFPTEDRTERQRGRKRRREVRTTR